MTRFERALIFAPRGRDAVIATDLLHEAGRAATTCRDLQGLRRELERGAGLAILAEEGLRTADVKPLSLWIAAQPTWSDFPFIVLTERGGGLERNPSLARLSDLFGNAIFLERPFHPRTLITAVDNALRGRRRQYEARAHLNALRDGENRLTMALTAGHLGAWEFDMASRSLVVSEHCKANFGRAADSVLGIREVLRGVLSEDRTHVLNAVKRSLATGEDCGIEFRVYWPDGSVHWIEMRARVVADIAGDAVRMVGVSSDITPRKSTEAERERLMQELALERERTQEALRGEKAFSSLMVQSAPAGIVAYDADLQVTTWNPVMERLFGLAAQSAIGRPLQDLLPTLSGTALSGRMREALAGRAGPIEEIEFALEGPNRVWLCEMQHAPLRGGDGQIAGGVAFYRDTTERRRAEEQLRQAQKMEAIGQLTGGVAHDFNNLLMAVLGNLDLLRKRMPHDKTLDRYIHTAIQGAQRGAALTQRLLAFARRQDLKPESVDLSGLVHGMIGLIERSVGPLITIELHTPDDLPPATVDPNQLELALLNLAVNSRDAMPRGGSLTIRLDRLRAKTGLGLIPGDYLRLSVADTGVGMDAVTLKNAIEPFFSTKELGKGTGLGLSMVHGLAVQSGGALHLSSEPGQGTIAELWLPLAGAPIRAVKDVNPPAVETPASIVLMVDDDALIAMSTVDMLNDLGHTVIEANCGLQALEILRSGAAVDILITDHAMPGMTGVELAAKARELRPNLPILLATGYADFPAGSDLPCLAKPYQQQELAAKLAQLLRGCRDARVVCHEPTPAIGSTD